MIRLPVVPKPYPDEILGSWLARIRYENHSGAWSQLKNDCGFSQGWLGRFDIPDEGAEYEMLFRVLGVSVEEVLSRLTTYPYFAALGSGLDLIGGTSLFQIEGAKSLSKLRVSRIPNASSVPKFCPTCVSDDVATWGEPYWHREHQLPNVYYCVHHQQLLRSSCPECGEVIAGGYLSEKLNETCHNGHLLSEIKCTNQPIAQLLSLAEFSVHGLKTSGRPHKKAHVIELINLLRTDLGDYASGTIWKTISKFYGAHNSERHPDYLQVQNPSDLDYDAFFLIKKNQKAATISWIYAVLHSLGADWEYINRGIEKLLSHSNKKKSHDTVIASSYTIDTARRIVEENLPVKSSKDIPSTAYWYLALYDHEWLKSRFPRLKPVPSIFSDRKSISLNVLSFLENSDGINQLSLSSPYIRAGFRDSIWRSEIMRYFKIASKPSEYDLKSSVFNDRANLIRATVEKLVTSPGPPQKIDSRIISKIVGLPILTVQAMIDRTPDLKSTVTHLRENWVVRRLTWAMKELAERRLPVTEKSLADVLGLEKKYGSHQLRELRKILNLDK